jgi:hypothetical protein
MVASEAFKARLTNPLASAANSALDGISPGVILTCAMTIFAALHY